MASASSVLKPVPPAHRGRNDATGVTASVGEAGLALATLPAMCALSVPLALLDLSVSLFQRICFPICGIERVRRSRYFTVDRHRLAYLNGIERTATVFFSYANGVLAYTREIAARAETYWCPVKHARPVRDPHPRYHTFVEYGDRSTYRRRRNAVRATIMRRERRLRAL